MIAQAPWPLNHHLPGSTHRFGESKGVKISTSSRALCSVASDQPHPRPARKQESRGAKSLWQGYCARCSGERRCPPHFLFFPFPTGIGPQGESREAKSLWQGYCARCSGESRCPPYFLFFPFPAGRGSRGWGVTASHRHGRGSVLKRGRVSLQETAELPSLPCPFFT